MVTPVSTYAPAESRAGDEATARPETASIRRGSSSTREHRVPSQGSRRRRTSPQRATSPPPCSPAASSSPGVKTITANSPTNGQRALHTGGRERATRGAPGRCHRKPRLRTRCGRYRVLLGSRRPRPDGRRHLQRPARARPRRAEPSRHPAGRRRVGSLDPRVHDRGLSACLGPRRQRPTRRWPTRRPAFTSRRVDIASRNAVLSRFGSSLRRAFLRLLGAAFLDRLRSRRRSAF